MSEGEWVGRERGTTEAGARGRGRTGLFEGLAEARGDRLDLEAALVDDVGEDVVDGEVDRLRERIIVSVWEGAERALCKGRRTCW